MELQPLRLGEDLVQDVVGAVECRGGQSRGHAVVSCEEDALESCRVDDRLGQHRCPRTLTPAPVVRHRLHDPPVLAPVAALASSRRLGAVYSHDASSKDELARLAVGDLCGGGGRGGKAGERGRRREEASGLVEAHPSRGAP